MRKISLLLTLILAILSFSACYEAPEIPTNEGRTLVKIVDHTETDDIPYAEALEEFFEDEEYEYFYSGIYSQHVKAYFSDGFVDEAHHSLAAGLVTLEDYDRFGIKYYKEAKADKKKQNVSAPPPMLLYHLDKEPVRVFYNACTFTINDADGKRTMCADALHPLQAMEIMPNLHLEPTYLSIIDPSRLYIVFHLTPDKISVKKWESKNYGNIDATAEKVEAAFAIAEPVNGNYSDTYIIQVDDEDAIFEVTATWESYENFEGTATYCFRTLPIGFSSPSPNQPINQ